MIVISEKNGKRGENMKKINNKGFTLIELLVVVAIIAILAGIVLVSLNSARERSEKASLQSTLSSVMPVISMCVNDGGQIGAVPADVYTLADPPEQVCSDIDDIDEPWPILPSNLESKGYTYAWGAVTDANDNPTTIVGSDADGPIITCTVATGSCVMN